MSPNQARITAVYHIRASKEESESIAEDIAFEQTVEVPEKLVTDSQILENVVGRVEDIQPLEDNSNHYQSVISYSSDLAAGQVPQLLNLLYGNISIKKNIRLADFDLPTELLSRFHGPNYGTAGIRQLTGVYDRPLLATALKPRGASVEELAGIAGAFARGGGDIVKDDHNLVDADFGAFCERVSKCQEAVNRSNEATGRNALYLPNVMAPMEMLERTMEYLLRLEAPGVLICPFTVGLDATRYLAEKYPMVYMAHPAFSGSFYQSPETGIDPGVLHGKLFRLLGMDSAVFPNYGGRFSLSREECLGIKFHLEAPLGRLRPALPAPAGGMKFERIPSLAEEYGPNTIYLIGGALLSHSEDLAESTRIFLDKIREFFTERQVEPERRPSGSCDLPAEEPLKQEVRTLMQFEEGFSWSDRPAVPYKATEDFPFKGVIRRELVGKSGEVTAFDLRYFEIEPGGFTSLEKHIHTHTVICVRGRGVVDLAGKNVEIKPFDVVYVRPLEVHQLKNPSEEPFGFFCIVDHERDRPIKP